MSPSGHFGAHHSPNDAPTGRPPTRPALSVQTRTPNEHVPGAFDPLQGSFFEFIPGSRPPITRQSWSDPKDDRIGRGSPIRKSRPPSRAQAVTSANLLRQRRRRSSGPFNASTTRPAPSSNIPFPSMAPSEPPSPTEQESQALPDASASPEAEDAIGAHHRHPSNTAHAVHEALRSLLHGKVTTAATKGRVYAITDKNRPHLVKIGQCEDFSKRAKALQSKCKIVVEILYPSREVERFKHAESLALLELSHRRFVHECQSCGGKPHKEWHEIDQKTAIDTVKKWERFMAQYPYDSNGNLRKFWIHLVAKRCRILPDTSDSGFDHAARLRYWTLLVRPPTHLDHLEYWLKILLEHPVWPSAFSNAWQISAISAWLVVFSISRTSSSFLVMFFHIFCYWLHASSSVQDVVGTKSKSAARKSPPRRSE